MGDLLVTSGMGGRYPQDLIVGRISGVSRRLKGRYQVVDVQTIVSAARQTTVYLATTRPPRPGRTRDKRPAKKRPAKKKAGR